MNAFQLIDQVANLGLEWTMTQYGQLIRCDGKCPLQKLVGNELSFVGSVGLLLERGVDIKTIRLVSQAADGFLFQENPEVSGYRKYMIQKLKPRRINEEKVVRHKTTGEKQSNIRPFTKAEEF